MFKWYYYHFVKFLNISDLEKRLLALASRASDPWTSTCHHFKILYYSFVKIYTKLHLFTLSFLNRYCLGKMFLDPIWSEHTWRKTFGICLPSGIPNFETFHLNDDRSLFYFAGKDYANIWHGKNWYHYSFWTIGYTVNNYSSSIVKNFITRPAEMLRLAVHRK